MLIVTRRTSLDRSGESENKSHAKMSLLHSSCNALQPRKRFLPRLVKNYM